jgi:protein O-GlcNAc transferase
MKRAAVMQTRDASNASGYDPHRAAGITRTVNAGIAHHQAGRLERAERLYRKALAKDPDNADALHLLGVVSFQRGDFRAAIELIERALPELDELAQAHLNLGNALLAAGEIAKAADSYRRAIGLDPDYGMAHSNLARALIDQGAFAAAREHSQRALALIPGFLGARVNFAEALMGLRRFAEAETGLRCALELAPDHAGLYRQLGRAIERQGRFADAVESFNKVAALVPQDPAAHYDLGRVLHAAGRLAEAAQSFARAVELAPGAAEVHLSLGNVQQALGRPDQAADSYRRAIQLKRDWNIDLSPKFAVPGAISDPGGERRGDLAGAETSLRREVDANPTLAAAHRQLGTALLAQGRVEEAIDSYRQAVALRPDLAEGYHHLGNALQLSGESGEAIAVLGRAVELRPELAEAHNDLGAAFHSQRQFHDAIECFRRAGVLKPDFALAHFNLGNALVEQSRLEEAAASYRKAIQANPELADAYINLGRVLSVQYRLEEAVTVYERALALRPDDAENHSNLGNLLKELGRLDEAVASYERALALAPDHAVMHNNLGAVLRLQGRVDRAIASLRQALVLDPELVEALSNLGEIFDLRGQHAEALACFERAVALDPDDDRALARWFRVKQLLFDWNGYRDGEARVRQGGMTPRAFSTPFILLGISSTAKEQFDRTRPLAQLLSRREPELFPQRPPKSAERLRIGYLSADFRQHPVAFLCAGVIEQHDRRSFDVLGYSYGPDDRSTIRRRFARAFDRFVDISEMAHRQAAEQIWRDELDILIDLTGYTGSCRPMILVHRPAPIQVNYLGYPGTMGADFIDYIIVDRFVVPAAQQPFFSERLVHLPFCYQCNDDQRPIAASGLTRADFHLPADGFVFCCFNNSYKITPDIFGIWMRLLRAVPGSVLWLLEVCQAARANLAREAAARGVEPERIVLAPHLPLAQHLGRHRLADLFLDTLPYNAHTTASDALWAGLPVLTCVGDTFAGRVAGSLLHAVGLPELATRSLEDYERLALRLAREQQLLQRYRQRLAENRLNSPLFDTAGSTRALEAAYREMHRRRVEGLLPSAFGVSDPPAEPPR